MCAKRTPTDTDLWAAVAKTVTPANREDVLHAVVQQGKIAPAPKKSATSKTPVVAPDVRPADLRSAVPVMRAGIDNASARRLTKGSFEIDDRLDLHGKTEAMAQKALHQFIQNASRRGDRTLLVITGKGAAGQGVLRRKVPEWLKEYPLKQHILALSQASPKDGGGGALYVRLRRSRDVS